MKKIISLLLLAGMTLSVAACGTKTETPVETKTETGTDCRSRKTYQPNHGRNAETAADAY